MTTLEDQKQLAIVEVAPIAANASAYLETVNAFQITDQSTCEQLVDMRKQVANALKKLEAKEKALLEPAQSVVKKIRELFKPAKDELRDADNGCKRKLDQYIRDQLTIEKELQLQREREATSALTDAAREADALRAQGAARTADAVEKSALKELEHASAPARVETVRGTLASLSTVKRWKARVVNLKTLCAAIGDGRLPSYLVEPKQAALDSLARETGKEQLAHGIEIYQDVGSSLR